MNERTLNAKKFLDKRFRFVDKDGYYTSHQPIYGFEKNLGNMNNYKRTYAILKEIEKLVSSGNIDSYLDVGCAEGYHANIVKTFFGLNTICTDLSIEACKRANEIYGFDAFASDSHFLPIKDNAFDLVLCSEMLEHVSNPKLTLSELSRITKHFLVITTPAARGEQAKAQFKPKYNDTHGHISIFTEKDMKNLLGDKIVLKGARSTIIWRIEEIIFRDTYYGMKRPLLFFFYRIIRPILRWIRKIYGMRMTKFMIFMDFVFSEAFPNMTDDHIVVVAQSNDYPWRYKPKKLDLKLLEYLVVKNKVEKHPLPKK